MITQSYFGEVAQAAVGQVDAITGPQPEPDLQDLQEFAEWAAEVMIDRVWGDSLCNDGRFSEREWFGLNKRLVAATSTAVATKLWERVRWDLDREGTDLVIMAGRLVESWHELRERIVRPEDHLAIHRYSVGQAQQANVEQGAAEPAVRSVVRRTCHRVVVVPSDCAADLAVGCAVTETPRIQVDMGRETAVFVSAMQEMSRHSTHDVDMSTEYEALRFPGRCGVASYSHHSRLFDALREAREVCEVAQLAGLPAGLYRINDVAFEILLARSPDVAMLLANQVQPIVEHSQQLFQTLRMHLSNDGGKKALANRLHIHENTLAYRLRRIEELTGFSPATPHGVHVLRAGCLAQGMLGDVGPRPAGRADGRPSE